MNFDEWIPPGTFSRGVVGGLLIGVAFFVLACLLRAFAHIREYGLWAYLKSAFRIDNDSMGLFLVLLILLLVVVLFFRPEPAG